MRYLGVTCTWKDTLHSGHPSTKGVATTRQEHANHRSPSAHRNICFNITGAPQRIRDKQTSHAHASALSAVSLTQKCYRLHTEMEKLSQ